MRFAQLKKYQVPDRGGYLYAWLEEISTSSTPAFCLLVNDPILLSNNSTRLNGNLQIY